MARKLYGSAYAGGYINIQDASATETTILGYSDLQDWLSARYMDQDILVPHLGSQVGKPAVQAAGVAPLKVSQNSAGLPFLEFDASAGAILTTPQAITSTYTIYAIVRPDQLALSQVFVGSETSTLARLFFGALSSGHARLDHGTGAGNSIDGGALTSGNQYIVWATYGVTTNAAAMGVNKRGSTATATFTDDQKVTANTCIGGMTDVSAYRMLGGVSEVLLFNNAHDLSKRTTILNFLSSLSGIAIVD